MGGPPGDDAFLVPADPGSLSADAAGVDVAATMLGHFGPAAWLVPGLAFSVPWLVVILTILAQVAGGLAWLPIVRRKIGAFGLRSESPARPH